MALTYSSRLAKNLISSSIYIACLILLGGILSIYIYQIKLVSLSNLYSDYGKFYQGLQFYLQHKSLYSPQFIKDTLLINNKLVAHIDQAGGDLNPPFFSFLLLPLGYLNFTTSICIWFGISIMFGVIGICFIPSIFNMPNKPLACIALITAFLAFFPVLLNNQFAQVGLVILPFIIGAWWAMRENNLLIAAILLAFLTSIKLFFGLFVIYFILNRHWRALAWYSLTILFCALIPLLAFKVNEYTAYHHVLNQIWWYATDGNASLLGFFLRVFGGYGEKITPLINLPYLGPSLYFFTSGVLMIALIKSLAPATIEKKDKS